MAIRISEHVHEGLGVTAPTAITEGDAILLDGSSVHIRSLCSDDRENHDHTIAIAAIRQDRIVGVGRANRNAEADEEHRERTAVAASLRPLLHPESIAVIGASATKGSPGRLVVRELL